MSECKQCGKVIDQQSGQITNPDTPANPPAPIKDKNVTLSNWRSTRTSYIGWKQDE